LKRAISRERRAIGNWQWAIGDDNGAAGAAEFRFIGRLQVAGALSHVQN
jgi:hypothetical protein